MSWECEIVTMLRFLINDTEQPQVYSDTRLESIILLSANYVQFDASWPTAYVIDMENATMTPDPTDPAHRDNDFISFLVLKAGCFVDQSTARTKALAEGIKAVCGPAALTVTGNLYGFLKMLEVGPCNSYEVALKQFLYGDVRNIRAIMSPFVSNTFYPYFSALPPYHRDRY